MLGVGGAVVGDDRTDPVQGSQVQAILTKFETVGVLDRVIKWTLLTGLVERNNKPSLSCFKTPNLLSRHDSISIGQYNCFNYGILVLNTGTNTLTFKTLLIPKQVSCPLLAYLA